MSAAIFDRQRATVFDRRLHKRLYIKELLRYLACTRFPGFLRISDGFRGFSSVLVQRH
jgi:hypothetical protein